MSNIRLPAFESLQPLPHRPNLPQMRLLDELRFCIETRIVVLTEKVFDPELVYDQIYKPFCVQSLVLSSKKHSEAFVSFL